MGLFLMSVSINENLMAKGTIDRDNLYASMEVMSQMVWVFIVLGIFGYLCQIAIIFQNIRIKQSIKKYNLSVIK